MQALGRKLNNAGIIRGQMERILHARVPIIKFKHSATGQSGSASAACFLHLVDPPIQHAMPHMAVAT